jgi:peptide deformylase
MIREIITYPNKLLRTKSKDVEEFNSELHTLLDDMYETMIAASGVGLAAIQIAVPLNVLIINPINEEDIQDKNDLIEAINPKIIDEEKLKKISKIG